MSEDVPMSQPAKAQEPSIEDILASIRRSIISDDDTSGPPVTEAATGRMLSRPKAEPKKASAKPAHAKNGQENADGPAGFDVSADAEPDAGGHAQPPAEVIAPGEVTPANAPAVDGIDHSGDAGAGIASGPAPERPLLSPRATAAVDNAFNSLAHTVLAHNPRTLEDLVGEMLKPMLKAWLDANLPNMVERLVRAEIERVSRGRG